MGRKPCCSKVEIKKGPWTSKEDKILEDYVRIHGEGKWRDLAQKAGLKRSGKSCRLRWLNYLRPDVKLGNNNNNISEDEEDLIIRLHRLLGNRWTLIAGRLPGRTGNEIKNYWKTTLSKKLLDQKNKRNLDANLEEKKKSEHQPQLMATSTSTPAKGPNPETKTTRTVLSSSEYNGSSISSLSLKENDDLMSFWVNSEIGDREEDDSEDVGAALGDYGFSSDNFSKEP